MTRHRLDDARWSRLYVVLRSVPNIHVGDENVVWTFVEAVVHVLRTGIAWPDLPAAFGDPLAIWKCFKCWAERGAWQRLCDAGAGFPMDTAIDNRWHGMQCAPRRPGRSCGDLMTKLHVIVDSAGRFVRDFVFLDQAAEALNAIPLPAGLNVRCVLGGEAYDAKRMRRLFADDRIEPVIPPRRNRRDAVTLERRACRNRHVIETVFAYLELP